MGNFFCVRQTEQTGSGVHPSTHPMNMGAGGGGDFLGIIRPGRDADH